MSRKNNAALAAILLAASGPTIAATIVEGLVNDKTVTDAKVYENDAKTGRCFLLVKIGADWRPVADSAGSVRLYANVQAATNVVARNGAVPVAVTLKEKESSITDPVKMLIARHKSMKAEDTKAEAAETSIDGKVAAAAALGWDVAVGTPEAAEYADLLARQVAVTEWHVYTVAQLAALAASLTTAGINPATYLPV